MFQLTPWSALPLTVILLSIWTLYSLKNMSGITGSRSVHWIIVGALIWSFAQFLQTLVTPLELKMLASQAEMVGKQIVPVAWFVFTLTFFNNTSSLSGGAMKLLLLLPCATLLIAFSNPYHHLLWSDVALTTIGGYADIALQPGPWFFLISAYSVSLALCGTAIAVHKLLEAKATMVPVTTLISVPLIVGVATLTEDAGFGLIPGINLTPVGLILAAVLLRLGVLDSGLLTQKRVRRHTVVERLSDMVVIVDQDASVLDYNVAAEKGLDLRLKSGQRYPKLTMPVLLELIRTHGRKTELTIGKRAYDVHATSLTEQEASENGDTVERVLVFRDITERRKAERALQEAKTELQTQAHTDPLTGLYNRRFFMQRLAEEGERLRRHSNMLSCLLFDLDHFKKVNDTYGHDAGDAVLKMVSEMTNKATRITDVAARVGGEEFAMLLPETDAQGAVNLANRLRESIANGEVVVNNQRISITASIGIVTVNKLGDNLDALLGQADKALYRAKDGGRNMVCIAN